jgi:hypothetical protein
MLPPTHPRISVCLPATQHPTYTPYLDQLCKFFFLSSAVHQAVFCLLSTLPFSGGRPGMGGSPAAVIPGP